MEAKYTGIKGFLSDVSAVLRPTRRDEDVPEIDLCPYRLSQDAFQVKLQTHGQTTLKEVYCRLQLWVRTGKFRSQVIDGYGWITTSGRTVTWSKKELRIPRGLARSKEPKPRAQPVGNVRWMATLSRRRQNGPFSQFVGRIVCSEPAPSWWKKLHFYWTYLKATWVQRMLGGLLGLAALGAAAWWAWRHPGSVEEIRRRIANTYTWYQYYKRQWLPWLQAPTAQPVATASPHQTDITGRSEAGGEDVDRAGLS